MHRAKYDHMVEAFYRDREGDGYTWQHAKTPPRISDFAAIDMKLLV